MKCFSYVLGLCVLTAQLAFAADPLDQWQWRNPIPTGNALRGGIYANNEFVAVGSAGTVLTSMDATNWTTRSSGKAFDLGDIVFGHDLFVAVGHGYDSIPSETFGAVWTSSNAVDWVVLNVAAADTLYSVTYGAGKFVAVGMSSLQFSGIILNSVDGTNWTAQTPPTDNFLRVVRFINNTFVILGDNGTILTSPDGINWVPAIVPPDMFLMDVGFGNGNFVAVGNNILTSTDGMTWTNVLPVTPRYLSAVCFGEGMFVVVNSLLTGSSSILTSQDAVNWSETPTPFALRGVIYGNHAFVGLGAGTIAVSSNAIDWTLASDGVISNLNDVAYGGGRFVAVSGNWQSDFSGPAGAILTSTNAVSWTGQTLGCDIPALYGVAYGNNTFIVVGAHGTMLTSTNGIAWTNVGDSNLTANLGAVCYGNGSFVAVGNGGALLTSTNGNNWVARDSGVKVPLSAVVYGKGQFVAVGINLTLNPATTFGVILTSTDTVSWTSRSNVFPLLQGIACGKGMFVGVGGSAISYSSNAVDWVAANYGAVSWLNRVGYAHGNFVAVGGNGGLLTSANGVDWVSRNSGTFNTLFGVAYGGGSYVAVGDTGSILQSGQLPAVDLHSGPLLRLPGGAYAVTVTGPEGYTWEMQGSTNLLDWEPLVCVLATNQTMQLIDYAATNFPMRFYRATGQ